MTRQERIAQRRAELARAFVWTEANRLARNEVKREIKAKGERVTDYTYREIMIRADQYLEANPSLIEQARANVQMITASDFLRR
jgi:hypothetical protein